MQQYHFPDIDRMPDVPMLPVPDLAGLNERFRHTLLDPAAGILRYSDQGHPIFGAYIGSDSNELITWSILAVGEWLSGHDASWLLPSWTDFFNSNYGIYLNSPRSRECELWYLFYANAMADAVYRALAPNDPDARRRAGEAADAMLAMNSVLKDDFDHQSYRFHTKETVSYRDIYRQPDTIAGYAYHLLFAALHADRPDYAAESLRALRCYQAFAENPWYEIPSGSAGLLAACWLDAHGHSLDIARMAGWVFDHAHGPLQIGSWGGEAVDGLMMGWRGDTREKAMSSAYSMETFMPLQFLLPAVRYAPALADAVGKYVRNLLSNFQLFYGRGSRRIYETRPDIDDSIPYERLDQCRDGHSPAACGDFFTHRSIYGSGYLCWLQAMARPTGCDAIYALDLSLTDWLAARRYPVFLLRNPLDTEVSVSFTPADVWQSLCPALYPDGELHCTLWDLDAMQPLGGMVSSLESLIPAHGLRILAALPDNAAPVFGNTMITYNNAELLRR